MIKSPVDPKKTGVKLSIHKSSHPAIIAGERGTSMTSVLDNRHTSSKLAAILSYGTVDRGQDFMANRRLSRKSELEANKRLIAGHVSVLTRPFVSLVKTQMEGQEDIVEALGNVSLAEGRQSMGPELAKSMVDLIATRKETNRKTQQAFDSFMKVIGGMTHLRLG